MYCGKAFDRSQRKGTKIRLTGACFFFAEVFDFILTGEELTTFSSDPFNVTFFPGTELSTIHNVTIVPDNLYEGFESFHLEITQIYAESSLQDQLRIGSSSPVRVTIVDNDSESAPSFLICLQ